MTDIIFINGDVIIGAVVLFGAVAVAVWQWVWRDDNNLFGE